MSLTNDDLLAISQLLDTKLDSKLKAELQPIRDEMQDMKSDIQDLKSEVQNVKSEVQNLKCSLNAVEFHLENVTDRNIDLLRENYVPTARVYVKSTDQIESMQADMDIMKRIIAEHSEKLQKIS